MTPGRLRGISLLILLVLSGLALLAWSQTWFRIGVEGETLDATGDVAAGALAPLALSGLLVVPALAIAGVVFRIVLGVLQALLGACIVIQAAMSLGDPITASRSLIADTTGIEGDGVLESLVADVQTTVWPTVALIAGVLLVVAGLAVAVTSRRWPGPTRKYQRARFENADESATDHSVQGDSADPRATSIDDWDALSGGDDPTAPGR